MKGKMLDKLNGRSRAVLDALREGRHAPVLRTPAPSPAPETRPCVICESTLTAERVRRYPRALTCSTDCSIEHQVRLNRVIGRDSQRRRRARRKQTADAGRGIGGEAGPEGVVRFYNGQRDSRAVDQGGEVRPELDSAVVPSVRGQPGASVSVHSGVQP